MTGFGSNRQTFLSIRKRGMKCWQSMKRIREPRLSAPTRGGMRMTRYFLVFDPAHAVPLTAILGLQRHRQELEELRMESQRLISQQFVHSRPRPQAPNLFKGDVMSFPHNPHTTRRVTAHQSAGPPRRRHFPARAQKVPHSAPEGQPPPVFSRTCAPLSLTPCDMPRPHPPLSME